MAKHCELGKFHNAEQTKDLQMRFCFDLLWHSGLTNFVCKHIYPYAHDEHIYTALRKICPKVTRKF